MTKKVVINPKVTEKSVFCCDCVHFQRDTEGISRNIETGEFYMGHCAKDCDVTPYGYKAKMFANKPRKCPKFRRV